MNDYELPLELPELENYLPGESGESPLSNSEEWFNVTDKNGRKGRRETNTMPQWAGSCLVLSAFHWPKKWYSLFLIRKKKKYWMPVIWYRGAEHAVLHLLYSRFWHKVLFDLGIVSTDEPYQRLFNQEWSLPLRMNQNRVLKSPDIVEEREASTFIKRQVLNLSRS